VASNALSRYYAAVDAGDFDTAMSLLDPDVHSVILLPGGAIRGEDRQALRDYLAGRGEVVRRHVLLRETVVDGLEFAYGAVVDDETTTTGHFIAAASLGEDGLVTGYQVAFDPELSLLPDA
jgi:hypothetical protein